MKFESLSIRVRICVCECRGCECACVRVCTHVCDNKNMCASVCACVYMFMCILIYQVCVYVHRLESHRDPPSKHTVGNHNRTFMCMCLVICINGYTIRSMMYQCECVGVCVCACVCVFGSICVHVCVHHREKARRPTRYTSNRQNRMCVMLG